MLKSCGLVAVFVFPLAAAPPPQARAPSAAAFDKYVLPLLNKECAACHNDRLAQGSLNLGTIATPASLSDHREGWERIIQRIQNGEMPPKGMPKPERAQVDALVKYVKGEFERADRKLKPDPGRVTAKRLNRAEYSNTIRDLLGVDFAAQRDFPTDDSGDGFDNIADVLTISPLLMEKYVNAAERLAARALGADPLPANPLGFEYHPRRKNVRRPDFSTIEVTHRVDWEAEYVIRIGMPGERAKDAQPVMMGFWMDGKLLHSSLVETKPSGVVYFMPFSMEEFRLALPEGDHTFRAGFIDDPFVQGMTPEKAYNHSNKSLESINFVGPFPLKTERASRKKILTCDPNTGEAACIDQIVGTLARRAYRRPVTKAEVAALTRFVGLARAEGQSVEQGIQLAIQAMLVSPHFLFRVEHDPDPNNPARVHKLSNFELASRLSYFLWSSMPDDQLLSLAGSGKLSTPAVLDAQIKRLLDDPKSAAFADNFAGQWLETRNLDTVKPDPQKFPEWGADLHYAMKMETRMFFEHLLRENKPMSEFIDANYSFLNDRLARHYGIEGVTGPEFRRVEFSELSNQQRGGILSHASVLTVSSYPTRTSPVIRGKYVLQNILGAPPPAPPANVPPLDEQSIGNVGTLRQQFEKHRASASCATCHTRMDTLGFGLENYDAIGKWRTMDGKFPLDVSGVMPNGKAFSTPFGMRSMLRDDLPEFSRCLTEKMLTYALGRGLERYDKRTVEEINRKVAPSGYRFQSLVYEIVRSLPFQSRRGEMSQVAPVPVKPQQEKPKEVASR